MMDSVVQFIRNALSCVKDLELFKHTFIHDATYTGQLLGTLPEPMDKTTPLEVLISTTQLYACLSTTKSGYMLLTTSIGKLRRILRIVERRMTNKPENWSQADRIVNESLLKEARFGLRSVFIGFLVTPIGIAFWWLVLNSYHITEVDWFGGLPALIHALEVMEICLLPLLYFMIVDGFQTLAKYTKTKGLLNDLKKGGLSPKSVSVGTYESMTGWVPFWDSGTAMFAGPEEDEEKRTDEEVRKVKNTLTAFFPEDKKGGEKEAKISKEALEEAEDKLEAAVPVLRMEGYREFLYFVFNFVAFYGYLMGIVAFYYEDDNVQPSHIRSLKFGYANTDADWTGNFAGDVMWTIEPLVILGSPFLVAWVKPQKKKVKAD
jgi:hypothetical protein